MFKGGLTPFFFWTFFGFFCYRKSRYLAIRVLDGFPVAQAARETYLSTTLVSRWGAVVSKHSVLLMIENFKKSLKFLGLCWCFDFCLFLHVHVFVTHIFWVFGLSSVDRMARPSQHMCSDWVFAHTVIHYRMKHSFVLHNFMFFFVDSAVSAVKLSCGWCCVFFVCSYFCEFCLHSPCTPLGFQEQQTKMQAMDL